MTHSNPRTAKIPIIFDHWNVQLALNHDDLSAVISVWTRDKEKRRAIKRGFKSPKDLIKKLHSGLSTAVRMLQYEGGPWCTRNKHIVHLHNTLYIYGC